MTKEKNYKKTLIACYLGFVTQAISANFAPLLFLTFKNTYGITLEKIAMIPLVFYLTQLLVDLAATKFADKVGYRMCVVASQVLSSVGLVFMAILPEVLPLPFMGILISLIILPNMLPAKMQPMLHVLQLQFSVTQLITALIGGVYAIIILAVLRNTSLGEQA